MKMTGGQALAQSLKVEGIETLFVLPGIQLDFFFDALWDERDWFVIHHTRHEQATAYMADGYARTTGRVAGSVVVPGPGFLNATAALSTAYACSSPVFCITSQIDSAAIDAGRGAVHEIPNQLGLMANLTKAAERANRVEEIPSTVRSLARALHTGRPRPVGLEVPMDILASTGDVTLLEEEVWDRSEHHRADPELLDQAAQILGQAERPLIYAGGGALSSGAWEEIGELARILEAPVLMSANGRGVLSDRDYRAQSGSVATKELVPNADAILVVGSRFGIAADLGDGRWLDYATGAPTPVPGKVVHVEIDPAQLGLNCPADVPLLADAKHSVAELVRRVPAHNRTRASRERELEALRDAQQRVFDATPLQRDYSRVIRDVLPEDGILVSESTQVGYTMQGGAFPVYQPRTFITAGYQGTLGYGYPTALGAQVGNPLRKVVSINGDGGFLYNVQELSTQVQQGIPVVTVVFNDNQYGNVRRIQEQRYNGHALATELKNPDFLQLAKSFDIAGYRATTPKELHSVLDEALDSGAPALIEVPMPLTQDLPGLRPMEPLPPRPRLDL